MVTLPTTCSAVEGAVVPMPTLTLFPSISELLCDTDAFAPIAVALLMPFVPAAPKPMNVLLLPAVMANPVLVPIKVLLLPIVLFNPAERPKKELLEPVVLSRPASVPKKALQHPEVLVVPASDPK